MSDKSYFASDITKYLKIIITILAVSASIFHLYGAVWGVFEEFFIRIIHLFLLLLLLYIIDFKKSYDKKDKKGMIVNTGWIVCIILTFGYLLYNYDYLNSERYQFVTPVTNTQVVSGIIVLLLILESARRRVGMVLVVTAGVFIAYYFVGPHLPGILYHSGPTLDKLIDVSYLRTEGIFGIPVGISSTFLIMFIIFGAFLNSTGFSNFINDFALGLFGTMKGGPAKVAVLASALMGMISGSSNANVVSTGSITIPLMKKIGYQPHFAGAVEAAASCGGQIMPPVMGAAAFMMVEYTGIPYNTIIRYAIFPGTLYFVAVMAMVHIEAVKLNLTGLKRDELPEWKAAVKTYGHLIIGVFILIYLLIDGFSPTYSAFYGIVSIFLLSQLRKDTRMGVEKLITALEKGAKQAITVAVSCATAGIIIGIVTLSGIGMRFASSFMALSGGNIIVALILAALAGIILGMGIPTVAAYVLMIALIIPALIEMGLEPHVAHLFAVYFAAISLITPPVAITSYAAAGIAESDVTKTSWNAMRLGISAYIVPFFFVFNPGLLLEGSFSEVFLAVVSAFIGIVALSFGLQAFMIRKSNVIEILFCIMSALLLIQQGMVTNIIGLTLLAIVYLMQKVIFPAPAVRSSRIKKT